MSIHRQVQGHARFCLSFKCRGEIHCGDIPFGQQLSEHLVRMGEVQVQFRVRALDLVEFGLTRGIRVPGEDGES